MNYELSQFENWLKSNVHPELFLVSLPSSKKLKELLLFAHSEKDRICKRLIELEFAHPHENLEKYVQGHQVNIINISDVIFKYLDHEICITQPHVIEFYVSLCNYLESILIFLQEFRTIQFDFDLPKTDYSVDRDRILFKEHVNILLDLYNLPGAEKALINLSLQPIKEFVDGSKRMTYRELRQLEELTIALKELLEIDALQDFNYEMHSILLQLNFNFPRYPLYCCYRLDEKLSLLSNQNERIERINWYIGMLQQIEHRPGFQFMKGVPPATQQILTSINNTYQYLLKPNGVNSLHVVKGEKIKLKISVAVLALFIKILIKSGIIINSNNAEVLRIIVESFSTPKSEQLSFDSIKGKYNKTPITTYRAIRKMLSDLTITFKNV
jgi:hypothetical protein